MGNKRKIHWNLLFLFTFIIGNFYAQQSDTTKSGTIKIKKILPDTSNDRLIGKWGVCRNSKYSTKYKCKGYEFFYTFYLDAVYSMRYPGVQRSDKGKWSYINGILKMQMDVSDSYGTYEIIWFDDQHFVYKQMELGGKKFYYTYFEKQQGR